MALNEASFGLNPSDLGIPGEAGDLPNPETVVEKTSLLDRLRPVGQLLSNCVQAVEKGVSQARAKYVDAQERKALELRYGSALLEETDIQAEIDRAEAKISRKEAEITAERDYIAFLKSTDEQRADLRDHSGQEIQARFEANTKP